MYAFEVLLLLTCVIGVLALKIAGVGITWWTFRFTVQDGIVPFLIIFFTGMILQLIHHWIQGQKLRSYLDSIRKPSWMLLWVRLWIACLFLSYSHMWLKLAIPLINRRLWDFQFWNLDIWLHAGISPSRFVMELFRGTVLVPALDTWYSWWLTISLYSLGFFCAAGNEVLRRQFAFSQIMIWTLGVWIYIGWPSLGPCYAYSEEWANLKGKMPHAENTQSALMRNYWKVVDSWRTGRIKAPFNPSYGIAAMPSLHVGIMWLLFLWSRKHARLLALFYLLGTVLTFLGSILTGWHYAVDGYAGILIAQLCYWAATLTERQPPPQAS